MLLDIEKELNEDCANKCNWFIENNLSNIHIAEDQIKSILFISKRKIKKIPKLDIQSNITINQHSRVSYVGCIL